jgi:AAA+ ATPase superfamily predicted ATPase
MRDFKNPFIYGGRVSGDAFCNRESEIRELLEDIRGRQHVIIYSQRRFGKTSLVWKILEEIQEEGIIPVYADLYPISTLGEFIEEYAKAIARTLSMYEKAKMLMRELFSRLHLSMGIDTAGNPQWSVGFDRSRESETFDEVVSSMENYLKRKGKYGVVVFDEFQQITETNGEKTERRLRSAIQSHEHISYLFVGSKRHLLLDL